MSENREIKFRAWLPEDYNDYDDPQDWYMTYDLAFEEYGTINDLLKDVEHLMQFTGLHDTDGREIYECDIIRESHHADGSVYDAVVRFDRGAFVLDFCELNNGRLGIYVMRERRPDNYRQWRVVGNIYERVDEVEL